jgi:hypothetical protein
MLSGVFVSSASAHRYPASIKQAFIEGCVGGGGTKSQCKCVIRKIERRYSLKRFMDLISEATGGLPRPMQRIVRSCARAYPS